ncbi:MAG TPA: DUF934 domain-containing protein [Caulobacteraceae bacterium]|jgi:uncharacterized protein (DUF934 family)
MSKLVKRDGDVAWWVEDEFVFVPDEEQVPATGDIIVTMGRLLGEGDALLTSGRRIGVRLQPHEQVENLAYDLPQLAVVELVFAKFRDGRPYSTASILRGRLEYRGEVRAIGDVLREQALHMVRCGFDAFVPADGSTPEEWMAAAHRYRHVYQRANDDRRPIFVERDMIASGLGHNRPDEVEA